MFALGGALSVVSCAGSAGEDEPDLSTEPGEDPPANQIEAARFLAQATFGPTEDEIERLMTVGFTNWFDEQVALAPSLQRPKLPPNPPGLNLSLDHKKRKNLWFEHAVGAPDQLRQKTAWALSQIFVVSTVDPDVYFSPLGAAEYYDILTRNAFGNYRELLEEITRNPMMGQYLDMLGNKKANPAEGMRPDENFAREIMQLFSIGLVKLNPDGTPMLDGVGEPIPTYDQTVVEGFAQVFTGWSHAGVPDFTLKPDDVIDFGITPMQLWEEFHDPEVKVLLDGQTLPYGQGGELDLEMALDMLFEHQNVGPFIGKLLIQRLVTSNPSPAYVSRVSAAFANDGNGVRGNLEAVVRAVLMDPEARALVDELPDTFGKFREPLLRQLSMWRAFNAFSESGKITETTLFEIYAQAPMGAPSVFNFYNAKYAPQGPFNDLELVAPEFEIATHTVMTEATNRLLDRSVYGYEGLFWLEGNDVVLDLSAETELATNISGLLDRLDLLITHGSMTDATRQIIGDYLANVSLNYSVSNGAAPGAQRAAEAVFMLYSSPEGAIQR